MYKRQVCLASDEQKAYSVASPVVNLAKGRSAKGLGGYPEEEQEIAIATAKAAQREEDLKLKKRTAYEMANTILTKGGIYIDNPVGKGKLINEVLERCEFGNNLYALVKEVIEANTRNDTFPRRDFRVIGKGTKAKISLNVYKPD